MRRAIVVGAILLALITPPALAGENKDVPYDHFAMHQIHPQTEDGIIIVPPWLREDGERTPETYRNYYKWTWEPLLRRI